MYEFNTGMKVFSRLYVGKKMQEIGGEWNPTKKLWEGHRLGTPLGFATPYEENAQGRKRQSTVDSWAGQAYAKNGEEVTKYPAEIIENDLQPGFKITDDVKRVYYGGGNVVFRVEDPRGFELEIQSQNLMTLIALVGLNAGGEIPGKCCWGRDGGANILIHETSEEYKNARLAAETIKPLKGIKAEFKRGDILILTTAVKVKYLGRFWFTGYDSIEESDHQSEGHEQFPHIEPLHFVSPKFRKKREKWPFSTLAEPVYNDDIKIPAGPMSGYRLVEPKQFHVVQDLENTDRVQLYRELKAVVVETPVDVEMSVKDALKFINSRTHMFTAGSSNTVYWNSASETKRKTVWKKAPLTQHEFDSLCKRIHKRNKDQHRHYGIFDYVETHDRLAKSPIGYVIEEDGKLWMATHLNQTNGDIMYALDDSDGPLALVRQHGSDIYITDGYYRGLNAFYSYEKRDIVGEPVTMPVFKQGPKEHSTEPLEKWFAEGKLFTLKPVYEGEE